MKMAAMESSGWRRSIAEEFKARRRKQDEAMKSILFPLVGLPFDEEEIIAMTEVLLSGRLTMGALVEEAEQDFAKAVGAPFAVMVNSGSSANLLAVFAMVSKLRASHCVPGDQVLVPAVCWATSVHPLIQAGLKPVFVDVDPGTFNVTLDQLEAKMNPAVKAIMAVHVLGNSIGMNDLMRFVRKHKLILIEDTCEALGTYVEMESDQTRRMLGTFGDFGTFSFFFSHHLTTGEGGMVVCKSLEDYNLLRSMRAHGWTRNLTNRAEVEAKHPDIDPRFVFINLGFNIRPMETQGAMLRVQLRRLGTFNAYRRDNMMRVRVRLERDPRYRTLMALMESSEGTDPAWFGIGVLLHQPYAYQLRDYLSYLEKSGIENRPIISGNFIRQPCITSFCDDERPEDYFGAEAIHMRGFFIGVHQFPLANEMIDRLVEIMLSFRFVGQHLTVVTGATGMLGRHVRDFVQSQAHQVVDDQTVVETESNDKWIFLTRKDGDLRDLEQVRNLFKRFTPTRVLHCAARLQGISEMTQRPIEFWLDNVAINNNVLQVAHECRKRTGPVKVVSVLSTVMFPEQASFPVNSSQIHSGPPPRASESYAFAKRALDKLTKWYRSQYQAPFVTVLPGNLYGAYGDFDPRTAPLVNSLIAKIELARSNGDQMVKMIGTGHNQRQVMWAGDFARVLYWSLGHLDRDDPLIVAGPELSIKQIAETVRGIAGFSGELIFDRAESDTGPLRRTADTRDFHELLHSFRQVSLEDGISRALDYYRSTLYKSSKL